MQRLLFIFFILPAIVQGQELFTYTEPASNMATKSIGIRMNNNFSKEYSGNNLYQLQPEIMWGASKKIMLHASVFFSNRNRSLTTDDRTFAYDGVGAYGKYRFYSQDEVHSHFRMAAFGRISSGNAHIHQLAIDLNGHNTGWETGIVATKLLNKTALSASTSYLHANDNGAKKFPSAPAGRDAIAYSLSVGRLILPAEYINYNQTNMNLMLEILGQYNMGIRYAYMDIAPSVQFIFFSRMRLDIGYRFAVVKDLFRTSEKGYLLRLEYNLFNVYK